MRTVVHKEEDSDFSFDILKIDALIRIKDQGGFFDPGMRRLKALLYVVEECEVKIPYICFENDIMIGLSNIKPIYDCPAEIRNSYSPFYREVTRVGLLIEKLALLIDPNSKIEVDFPFPVKDAIVGKTLLDYSDYKKESSTEQENENLSTDIPNWLYAKISSFIDFVFPAQNCRMGDCHAMDYMQKMILRYGFNIDYKTMVEQNPGVIFD